MHCLLGCIQRQVSVEPDVFIQVGARAESCGAVGTGVGLLTAVGSGMLSEPGGHAEALSTNPAAERPQAAVDALMVLQMGQLAEPLATCGTLVKGGMKENGTKNYLFF